MEGRLKKQISNNNKDELVTRNMEILQQENTYIELDKYKMLYEEHREGNTNRERKNRH